ncbi:MAG: DUF805 domain-containing protein [Chloroflexi bacterium]|nr:DUF805 domain-containing protein [Chloroflexota bacterium]
MLFQDDGGGLVAGVFGLFFWVCYLAIFILVIAGMWKTFVKAGQPGWASIIPFYNLYIMLQIVGRPGWWLILFFIPLANIIVVILLSIDMAKSFGKDALYGLLLLWILAPIGYLMLGFGDAEYQGPSAA